MKRLLLTFVLILSSATASARHGGGTIDSDNVSFCGDAIQGTRQIRDEASFSGPPNGPKSVQFLEKARETLFFCMNASRNRGSTGQMLKLAKENCELAAQDTTILFLASCYFEAASFGFTTMGRNSDPIAH